MVLVAPPDAGRGRGGVPRHRAGLPRVRPVRPAAGGRGGASLDDLVADVLGILDALSVPKVSIGSPKGWKDHASNSKN
jgi:hypothetical protein